MNWARARAGHLRLGSFEESSVRRGMWNGGRAEGVCRAGATSEGPKGGWRGPEEVQGQEGAVVRWCGRLRESKACRRQEQWIATTGTQIGAWPWRSQRKHLHQMAGADSPRGLFSRPRMPKASVWWELP